MRLINISRTRYLLQARPSMNMVLNMSWHRLHSRHNRNQPTFKSSVGLMSALNYCTSIFPTKGSLLQAAFRQKLFHICSSSCFFLRANALIQALIYVMLDWDSQSALNKFAWLKHLFLFDTMSAAWAILKMKTDEKCRTWESAKRCH